jgi:hypothetical protein
MVLQMFCVFYQTGAIPAKQLAKSPVRWMEKELSYTLKGEVKEKK